MSSETVGRYLPWLSNVNVSICSIERRTASRMSSALAILKKKTFRSMDFSAALATLGPLNERQEPSSSLKHSLSRAEDMGRYRRSTRLAIGRFALESKPARRGRFFPISELHRLRLASQLSASRMDNPYLNVGPSSAPGPRGRSTALVPSAISNIEQNKTTRSRSVPSRSLTPPPRPPAQTYPHPPRPPARHSPPSPASCGRNCPRLRSSFLASPPWNIQSRGFRRSWRARRR